MQHKKYQNIFALTDKANMPNDNKDALTKKRTPILVKKLFQIVKHDLAAGRYPEKKTLRIDYEDLILPDLIYYDHTMNMSQLNKENPQKPCYYGKNKISHGFIIIKCKKALPELFDFYQLSFHWFWRPLCNEKFLFSK